MQWLEHIKRRKKECGFTNETLSEKSGISVGTLNKLLSGATTDPKLSTLLALAQTFECTVDELLGFEKKETFCPIGTVTPSLAKAIIWCSIPTCPRPDNSSV